MRFQAYYSKGLSEATGQINNPGVWNKAIMIDNILKDPLDEPSPSDLVVRAKGFINEFCRRCQNDLKTPQYLKVKCKNSMIRGYI